MVRSERIIGRPIPSCSKLGVRVGEHGWSRQRVAGELGTSTATRLCRGARRPGLEASMRLVCSALVAAAAAVGCGGARAPAREPATAEACDARQLAISRDADARAAPWSIARHLRRYFPDGRAAWVMAEARYREAVVRPAPRRWGRCNDTACFQFAAPAALIHDLVKASMRDGRHDPAVLGQALGLPAAKLAGPLRMMTLDVGAAGVCVRLPVDDDPGALECATPEDTGCFRFGGFTSGGVPEVMLLDAPIDRTAIEEVP